MTDCAVSPWTAAGKPQLDARPLLAPDQARELADLYQVLANDTRLRLLHALARSGELCVTDLAAAVAMRPQAVSNQLQRLTDRGDPHSVLFRELWLRDLLAGLDGAADDLGLDVLVYLIGQRLTHLCPTSAGKSLACRAQ